MFARQYLGVTDYVVICLSLIISAAIGVTSKINARRQENATEYLLAGQKMSKLPVILSIVVTLVSTNTLIGVPSEVYKYGFEFVFTALTVPFGMYLAAKIFIPVFFQCKVSTANEFLELRFGKMIRYIISALFLVQMMFYIVTSLYGATLTLSAVTILPLEISIVSLGVICTFYCSLGGLRAVLWTDVFQAILIVVCFIQLFVAGVTDGGGVSEIYRKALEGQRLNLDFSVNFIKRFSVWGGIARGFFWGFGYYGTNQIEIQRILSLSNAKRAKSTLQLSSIPGPLVYFAANLFGIVLYSVHYLCDPVLNKEETGIEKYDMLVPAYMVQRFASIPGMTGLCIAGIFSASLSTISSALNCASTVTVIDFIKPLYKKKGTLSDGKVVLLAKILSVLYGGLCIGLSFCFLEVRSLLQLMNVMVSSLEGPMVAIFAVGVLTRKANDKVVSFTMIISYALMVWLSFGALFSNYIEKPLPLNTSLCVSQNITSNLNISSFTFNNNLNYTSISLTPYETETFILYKISFLWYGLIGFILALILILFGVLMSGWKSDAIPPDSKCLSPVTRYWIGPKILQDTELFKNEFKAEDAL